MIRVQLNDNALTTVEAIFRYSRLSATEAINQAGYTLQEQYGMLINQMSSIIEGNLDRKLGRQQYTEKLTGTGRQTLVLHNYPIVSVESVFFNDELIESESYDFIQGKENGILYRDTGWPCCGFSGGLSYDTYAASRAITVNYTAGYVLPKDKTNTTPSDLPSDLEHLCIEMVLDASARMESGNGRGLKSFSISDVSWTWTDETPPYWESILQKYRRFSI